MHHHEPFASSSYTLEADHRIDSRASRVRLVAGDDASAFRDKTNPLSVALARKRITLGQASAKRTLFCFAAPCPMRHCRYDVGFLGFNGGSIQVAETSAKIIDFSAYRRHKRTALESPSNESQQSAPDIVPIGIYFFWPVLAWMPICLLLAPSVAEDFA